MKTIEVGKILKTKIELYETPMELPMVRYHEYQNLSLLDVHIGSDMNGVGAHFGNLYKMIGSEQYPEALQEIQNLSNNFFYMIEKINLKSHCFVMMVKKIGKEEIPTLIPNDQMQSYVEKVSESGLTQGMCESILNEVKKNLIQSYESTFLINTQTVASITPFQSFIKPTGTS